MALYKFILHYITTTATAAAASAETDLWLSTTVVVCDDMDGGQNLDRILPDRGRSKSSNFQMGPSSLYRL